MAFLKNYTTGQKFIEIEEIIDCRRGDSITLNNRTVTTSTPYITNFSHKIQSRGRFNSRKQSNNFY